MKSTLRSGLSYIILYNLEYWTSTRDQLQNRMQDKKAIEIEKEREKDTFSQRTMKATTKRWKFIQIEIQ